LNWNKEALEAWLEEAARKDDDAMIVEKYAQVDDGKIKATDARCICLHSGVTTTSSVMYNLLQPCTLLVGGVV